MSNSLLTLTMITRESLRITHNNLVFVKGINRQYSKEFAQVGAKIGSTINVRMPNKYTLRKGQQINIQGTTENYTPLTLTTQYGVDVEFSSQDLTLSLDDFGKRILSPAMAKISSGLDFDGLGQFSNVYNNVGTAGTTPGSNSGSGMQVCNAPMIFLNAGVMMDNLATPRDDNRRIVLNPIAQATSANGLSGLFNDQATIGEQYRKGVLGSALGFEFAMDQNINLITCGSRATANITVTGANQTGGTVSISGFSANQTINAGELISFANVTSVNPENLQSTGTTATFVVTATTKADANGNMTALPISPSITLTGANQTCNASPANGAAVTITGAANSTYVNNLAYHQDAFTMGTADLILPGGVDFAARENYDGISMRIVRAYDITNDLFPARIDVLAGFATLRPEFACRILG